MAMSEEINKQIMKALRAGAAYSCSSGRFKSSASQPMVLLKDRPQKGDAISFNYATLEPLLFCDTKSADARRVGASPSLGAPFGQLSADILSEVDVVYGYHNAKVVRDLPDGKVLIRFENDDLIPNEMEVATFDLQYRWGGRYVNSQLYCPRCDVPWKETPLARFSVFDCPSCGAKKEDHAR